MRPTVESSSFREKPVWLSRFKKMLLSEKDKVDKEEEEADARQTESKTNIVIYNFNLPNKADNLIRQLPGTCASRNQGRAENED